MHTQYEIEDGKQEIGEILKAKAEIIKQRLDLGRQYHEIIDDEDVYLDKEDATYVYEKYILGWSISR